MAERRQKRSSNPIEAAQYQLAYARRRGGLDAIVLADRSGHVVAASGPSDVCEELAEYAPLLSTTSTAPTFAAIFSRRKSRLESLRHEVDAEAITLQGKEVYLCARGGARRVTLKQTAEGITRIFASVA